MTLRRLLNLLVSFTLLVQSSLTFSFSPVIIPVQSTSLNNLPVFDSPLPTPIPQPLPTITPTPQPITSTVIVSATEAVVDARGGRVATGNRRVQLDVPPGLFQRSTRVKIAPRVTGSGSLKVQFDLTAREVTSGAELTEFAQPITLTVDMRNLPDFTPEQNWFLAYQDPANPNVWHKVDSEWQDAAGIVQARITHFSTWGAGSEPGQWHYQWQPPSVSTFSGAATYHYPIPVPPGRNGLTPNVDITYSSRGVDGLVLSNQDEGLFGLGWSMADIEISRNGVYARADGAMIHPDSFSLALNGSRYALQPAAGSIITEALVTYYAEQAPQLLVQRIYTPTAVDTNPDRIYWLVKTGSGITYRLGYTPTAESGQSGWLLVDGHGGALGNYSGLRWRADTVTDVSGNQLQYDYAALPDLHDTYNGHAVTSGARVLAEIRYNYATLAPDALMRVTSSYHSKIVIDRSATPLRIKLYQADLVTPYKTIEITKDHSLYQECGQNSGNWFITQIREVGRDGVSALPATTFNYAPKPHGKSNCFQYDYLQQVNNGYGGSVKFTYQADGRWDSSGGCVFDPNTPCGFLPAYGQSYVAVKTETWDGVQSQSSTTNYQFESPCYDQTDDGYLGTWPGAKKCPIHTGLPGVDYGHSPIIGFAKTTVTTTDDGGQTLNQTVSQFYQDRDRLGREWQTQAYDGSPTPVLLTQANHVYSTMPVNGTAFTYLSDQINTTWNGGLPQTTRSSSTYDGSGNLIAQYDYGAEEMLVNAGFENGLANWTSTVTVTSVFTANTAMRFAGQASVQMQSASAAYLCENVTGVISGTAYVFRAWAKAAPGSTAQLTLVVNDGSPTGPSVSSSALTPSTTTWQPISVTYTANATALVNVCLGYAPNTSGAIYVDETALARASDVGDECSNYTDYNINPDTAIWIVKTPKRESIYSGIWFNDNNLSYLRSRTRYRYDGACLDTVPVRGAVTAVDRWNGLLGSSGCDDPAYATTKTDYDQWGNAIVVTDARVFTTTTAYDGLYHLYPVQMNNALGQSTQVQYDLTLGVPLTVTDPNGGTTNCTYDTFGRLLKVIRPGDTAADPSVLYAYSDVAGQSPYWVAPLRIAEAHKPLSGGPGYRHLYDGLGREIQTQGPANVTVSGSAVPADIVVSKAYDARGMVIWQTAPYTVPAYVYNGVINPYTTTNLASAPKTLTQYDALSRAVAITNTDGTTTTTQFKGRQTATRDANGHLRVSEVDAFGRLSIMREYTQTIGGIVPATFALPAYATTRYTYDVLGNLRVVTDALGNTTTMIYDPLGRKTAMSDPDMGYWTYQYDNAGNLTTQTDALDQKLWFKYDPLNRLTEKRQTNSGGNLLASYTYDQGPNGVGQRTRMDDPSGWATWTYDNRGRMTQETKVISNTGGGTFVTQYGYDAMDRPVWMKYPGGNAGQIGEQVNFTYNAAGLLNSVIGASTYAQSMTYDAVGRVTQRVLGGNVLQQNYVYYPWTTFKGQGRLQQIKAGVPGNLTSLQDLNYTYDAVGNVLTILDNKAGGAQTQTFTYDALDRLQTAQATGGTGGTYALETYTYDPIGNIKSKPGVGVYTYTASATGCVAGTPAIKSHAVSGAGTYTFGYDCNGNMLTRNDSTGNFSQYWDKENRLITVTGSATGYFVYDGDGNRVKATLNGVTTAYVGNYYEQSGSVTTTYYYAGGARIAMRQGSSVSYLLGDHLGSTSITANSSGGLSAEQRYKPWGEQRYTNGATPTRHQYTGQINDSEIGLYFYGARYYSSAAGRFISADTIVPDPSNPQQFNRYSYGLNDPVKYKDPTGHCSLNAQNQEEYDVCIKRAQEVEAKLGIRIEQYDTDELWTFSTLNWLYETLYLVRAVISENTYNNYFAYPQLRFAISDISQFVSTQEYQTVWLGESFFKDSRTFKNNVLHELEHGLVYNNDIRNGGSGAGEAFAEWYALWVGWKKDQSGIWINPGTGPSKHARGEIPDVAVNPEEDSADTFAAFLMPCADNDRSVTPCRLMWLALWVQQLRGGE
jgi:RHS repeat-associated protein